MRIDKLCATFLRMRNEHAFDKANSCIFATFATPIVMRNASPVRLYSIIRSACMKTSASAGVCAQKDVLLAVIAEGLLVQ